jgi:hypothetical protein
MRFGNQRSVSRNAREEFLIRAAKLFRGQLRLFFEARLVVGIEPIEQSYRFDIQAKFLAAFFQAFPMFRIFHGGDIFYFESFGFVRPRLDFFW